MTNERDAVPPMARGFRAAYAAVSVFTLAAGAAFSSLFPLPFPDEARSLFFSGNFLVIGFFLSLYDNLLPLYYAFARAASFLPGGLLSLRLLSSVFFLCGVHCARHAVSRSRLSPLAKQNSHALIIYPSLFLALESWRATPFSFSFMLVALSWMLFIEARRNPGTRIFRLHAAATIAAAYSCEAGIISLLVQAAAAVSGKRSASSSGVSLRPAILASIPAALILVSGAFKTGTPRAAELISLHLQSWARLASSAPGNPALTVAALASALVLFALTLLAARAENPYGDSRASYQSSKVPSNVFILIAALFVAAAFRFSFFQIESIKNKDNARYVKNIERLRVDCSTGNGVVFFDSGAPTDRHVFRYFNNLYDCDGLLYGEKKFPSGSILPESYIRAARPYPFNRLKEYALRKDAISLHYASGGLRPDAKTSPDMAWFFSSFEEDGGVFRLKKGFSKDGVLLGLFAIDYADREKAAALIQADDFEPWMLKSYYGAADGGDAKSKLDALALACGSDAACLDAALSKTLLFAASDADSGALVANAVSQAYPDYAPEGAGKEGAQ